MMAERETNTTRDVSAGCHVCHGAAPGWRGAQAHGTAARHHDRTGHATWVVVVMGVAYGSRAPAAEQLELEAAIAAVPA